MMNQPAAQAAEAWPQSSPRSVVLLNPNSFRMSSRERQQRIEQLADKHDLALYPVHGPREIAAALEQAQPGPEDRVIIIGGDGTLQAAVSSLAVRAAQRSAPQLCMLGGGRTNFTARDLGSHAHLLVSLEQLVTAPNAWRSVERQVLRIEGSENGPLYGFFVAGALIDSVIRDCHSYRARSRGWLKTGHLATAWRLSQLGLYGIAGRTRFPLPALDVDAGSLGSLSGPTRVVLITSLHHERGQLDPYADRGEGPVRLTAIHADARPFWRRLPALLAGRFGPDQNPRRGCLSGRTQRLSIRGLPSICLDGQEFSLDPSATLHIHPGPAFRFLQP